MSDDLDPFSLQKVFIASFPLKFHHRKLCDKLNFVILSRLRRLLFPLRLGCNEDGSAARRQCLSLLITLPRLLITLATINVTSRMDEKKGEDGENEMKN